MWWQWLFFLIIFISTPIIFYSIFKRYKIRNEISSHKTERYNKNLIFFTCYFWCIELFYMASLLGNTVATIVLGVSLLCFIFYTLASIFLESESQNHALIIVNFVFAVFLSFYVIYLIPDEKLQNIVIPIIAALYGGLLTLLGVAWTIKKSNQDRKTDEKNKAKPVFTYNLYLESPSMNEQIRWLDGDDKNKKCLRFYLENSEKAVFTIKRIYIDDNWVDLKNNNVVLPSKKLLIQKKFEHLNEIYFEIEDSIKNHYYYKAEIDKTGVNNTFVHTIENLEEVDFESIKSIINEKEKESE